MGTVAVVRLAASGSVGDSVEVTAPSTAGMYYYGACVDAVTDESDTNDNCSTSIQVEVETPPPSGAPVGETVTYTARVLDENGDEMSGYGFSWSSSDEAKATVDASGVVTAHAVGEATITASASATASAAVKARPLARDFGALASNCPVDTLGFAQDGRGHASGQDRVFSEFA